MNFQNCPDKVFENECLIVYLWEENKDTFVKLLFIRDEEQNIAFVIPPIYVN